MRIIFKARRFCQNRARSHFLELLHHLDPRCFHDMVILQCHVSADPSDAQRDQIFIVRLYKGRIELVLLLRFVRIIIDFGFTASAHQTLFRCVIFAGIT